VIVWSEPTVFNIWDRTIILMLRARMLKIFSVEVQYSYRCISEECICFATIFHNYYLP